jgi:pimeloyl-ACP methyl ester carboxylesterase
MIAFFLSSHGSIAYTDSQTGELPIIFMHGLPTCKEMFNPVLPHLPHTIRAITFDLNDYGQSEKIGKPISHKERAAVLDELRAHLGLAQFVLVAHDLGASVAIDYMSKYGSHVSKLVLMSPPVYPDFVEPTIVKITRTPWLGELLVLLLKKPLLTLGIQMGMVNKGNYTMELRHKFATAFSGSAGRKALLRNLRWGRPATMFADYPAIIKNITIPTLVIQGRQDPYIPYDHAVRLANDIPYAQLTSIEDGAHFLPMDTPKAVADAIQAHIFTNR